MVTVDYKTVYLIGIGGIGMSAIARWYKAKGAKVAGYDKTKTGLTNALMVEGIDVHYEDSIVDVPADFKGKETLVIYTPAIPETLYELNYFRNNGNKVVKRAQALGEITQDSFTIAVAGTHGKTTTSSMVAHILKYAGKNCFAFLGGISQNYQTNLLYGDLVKDSIMVVEADEYDRSFLWLHPDIAVITAVDPDHLDIYKDGKFFLEAFEEFATKINKHGTLVYKENINIEVPDYINKITFGSKYADYKAEVKNYENFTFDITKDSTIEVRNLTLQIPGYHNIQNALAAYAVARLIGIEREIVIEALKSFKGVKRRFEILYKSDKIVYIDDYAHHPTEIDAVLTSLKGMYPDRKITVIFQPHLYSRTNDFLLQFAESLSLADKVILLEIYPARELPIPGVSSTVLLEIVNSKEKILLQNNELLSHLNTDQIEVLITLGAGDIDQFVLPITDLLSGKNLSL